jgi:hypothetical protein
MKFGSYLTPYAKINSKWTKNLNVRVKVMTALEENIWINTHDVGLAMDS